MNHKLLGIVIALTLFALSVPVTFAACNNACSSSQYTCSLTTSTMTRGTSGTLEVSVTNQQSQTQSSVAATLLGSWFTGETTSQVISSISAGESKSVSFTLTPNTAGSQDVCVSMGGTCTADCTQVSVTSPAELSVVSITPSSTTVATSASFTVSATIQNGGTEAAGGTTAVAATLSSTSGSCSIASATRSIGTIAGSSSSSQSWTVTAPSSAGTCAFSLAVSGTPGGTSSGTTSVTVSTTTTTTAAATTGGTTSGGAAGEVQPGTKVTITKGKATITIPSVAAGKAALVNVTKIEETNVKKISVTVVNAVKNIQIIVEKPADKPAEVTNPSETVYHYLKVDKTNFTDSDVSSATIDFQVEKAWLTANNIDESTVALNRYESSGWRKLTTTKLSSNTTHVSYSAQSPGLSVFAITGSQPSAATTTTTVPQAGAATTTTTTVPGQQPPGAAPSGGTDMLILGFVGLVVIAIVGAAYYYKRQPKGGFSYKAR